MRNILGQTRAIAMLQGALRSDRIHHAWIFAGPAGVGKFTTAIEFARVLLDPAAGPNLAGVIEADPAGETSRLIDAGTHPDLHVIRKELARYSESALIRNRKLTNIPVDVLREHMIGGMVEGRYIDPKAHATAVRGHGKVFIIDEAELVDPTGQNIMLKTLEEPPPRTYIVLVTSRPDRLLPTIRSRCSLVKFTPLDDEAIGAWISQADLSAEPRELEWVKSFAQGSPGQAELAMTYGFYQWHQSIDTMLQCASRGEFPAELGEAMAALVEDFAIAWVKNHKNASKDAANKAGARHMFAILASYAQNHLRRNAPGGGDVWMQIIDLVRTSESQLFSNVNQKMIFENLVVQWTRIARRQAVAV